MKRKQIKVNTRCVADAYSYPNEKIVEFSAVHDGELIGGLISFRLLEGGRMVVELYNLDNKVEVIAASFNGGGPTITIPAPRRT